MPMYTSKKMYGKERQTWETRTVNLEHVTTLGKFRRSIAVGEKHTLTDNNGFPQTPCGPSP